MIIIESLKKSFAGKVILQNITATFHKGCVSGIVGENGSGKTTLFKCIAGLESYEGLIKSEYKSLKDHIGFLQTDPYYFTKITGKEYIQLLCNARHIKPGNWSDKNIFDLPLSQYASTYSTGMKKKLALTAILFQHNEIFILDEPYNGVDIHSNILITEIIHKLKALNKIIIISSHIFSSLHDTCDEIYLLKQGSFIKNAAKNEFAQLEQEMKDLTIGNKIEKLGLE